jgi:hypothetical protein
MTTLLVGAIPGCGVSPGLFASLFAQLDLARTRPTFRIRWEARTAQRYLRNQAAIQKISDHHNSIGELVPAREGVT